MHDRSSAAGPTTPTKGMTASQVRCFDELLAVGGPRPVMPAGLPDELAAMIEAGTVAAVERWTEKRLFVTKAQIATALRCEGQLLADRDQVRSTVTPASAIGTLSHRAIQIAHTHPGRQIADYVKWALSGARTEDDFSAMWDEADPGLQSDLLVRASSMLTAYLDAWPPLDDTWTPRFEEPIQAKIGKLTLSSRADLVLGRPRTDLRQTMFLCDFKTGSLSEHHDDEASFYALVSTLRHGVAPYRSTVYSLASGDWSDPDVDAARLRAEARRVIDGVNAVVDLLTEQREPTLTAGTYCRWCPRRDECPAHAEMVANGGPVAVAAPKARVTQPAPSPEPEPVVVAVGAMAGDVDDDPFELP